MSEIKSNSNSMNAVVIAGGIWQVPLIQFLQGKGHRVVVVDPYRNSPGVLLADEHIQLDVRDEAAIRDRLSGIPLEFITTDQSDISVDTCALLSAHFHLPGNPVETVRLFTNKLNSRRLARSLDIPIPEFCPVFSIADVKELIAAHGLPVILKPCDSQSSRGIQKVDSSNISELESLMKSAFQATRMDHILCERFFEGTEITAEGICSGGKHRTLAMSYKRHFRTGIASMLEYPADVDLPSSILARIEASNDRYVEESGLRFGITHAEYLVNNNNEYVMVEIACRGGGSLISSNIVPWVSGFAPYEALYGDLTGEPTDVRAIHPLRRNAILKFFEFRPGCVAEVRGVSECRNIPGVFDIRLMFDKGSVLAPAGDDRSRHGFVIAFAGSKSELDSIVTRVRDLIQVTYEDA